ADLALLPTTASRRVSPRPAAMPVEWCSPSSRNSTSSLTPAATSRSTSNSSSQHLPAACPRKFGDKLQLIARTDARSHTTFGHQQEFSGVNGRRDRYCIEGNSFYESQSPLLLRRLCGYMLVVGVSTGWTGTVGPA